MNYIKSKWRSITFLALIISYVIFIFIMDKRVDYLYTAGVFYLVITAVLFLGTIIGIPGIILHSIFKNEKLAFPFYKLAINLGSTNTNILTAYGLISLRNYEPKEALEIFKKAKETTKQFLYHKTLTANMALCEWKLGNYSAAAKTYEDLFYFPDLEHIEDYSLENLDEGISKNHNFFAQDYTTMAYLMFLNKEVDKAEYFSQVALNKLTTYGPAFDNLGQIEYTRGNFEKAIEHFKEGLVHKPNMSDSHYFLAKIAVDQKNKELATTHINEIDVKSINGLSTITKEDVLELEEIIKKL